MQCMLRWRADYLSESIHNILRKHANTTSYNKYICYFNNFTNDISNLCYRIKRIWENNEQKIFETFEQLTKQIVDLIESGYYDCKSIEYAESMFEMNSFIIAQICTNKFTERILFELNFKFGNAHSNLKMSKTDLWHMTGIFNRFMSCFGYNDVSTNYKINNDFRYNHKYEITCKTNILNIYFWFSSGTRLNQPYLNRDIQKILYDLLNNAKN